jgi:outer membrane autotransporter protein
LGLAILDTLNDRVGDTYEPDGVAPAVAPGATQPGPPPADSPLFSPSAWGRFFGQTISNRYQAFADPRASGDLGGFQLGMDLLRGSISSGHYERAGLYGAFGAVNVNVEGLVTNPQARRMSSVTPDRSISRPIRAGRTGRMSGRAVGISTR